MPNERSILYNKQLTGCGDSGTIESERTCTYSVNKIELQTEIGRPRAAIMSDADIMMLCANGDGYDIVTLSESGEHQYDVSPYAMKIETHLLFSTT